MCVRPVLPGDAHELQRAFALLSPLSRYQRFHTGTPTLTNRVVRFLVDVDHTDHEALVAIADGTSDIVGVARYIRYRAIPLDADLAVTVSDSWQQVGLGAALLRLLAVRAREEGVGRLTAEMLADNAGILSLIRAAGGVVEPARGPLVRGHIDLAPLVDTPGCGRAERSPLG